MTLPAECNRKLTCPALIAAMYNVVLMHRPRSLEQQLRVLSAVNASRQDRKLALEILVMVVKVRQVQAASCVGQLVQGVPRLVVLEILRHRVRQVRLHLSAQMLVALLNGRRIHARGLDRRLAGRARAVVWKMRARDVNGAGVLGADILDDRDDLAASDTVRVSDGTHARHGGGGDDAQVIRQLLDVGANLEHLELINHLVELAANMRAL